MCCEICGTEDREVFVVLPLHQPDGKLDTIVCLACAEKSRHYCLKHQRPHLGFADGTTACLVCIEERTIEEGEKIADALLSFIQNNPSLLGLSELYRWGEITSLLSNTPEKLCYARAVLTRALRLGKTPDEIIREVEGLGSVEMFLPQHPD